MSFKLHNFVILFFLFISDTSFSNQDVSLSNKIKASTLKDKAELKVNEVVQLISHQKAEQALQKIVQLRKEHPNFLLAKVIHSDLLLSQTKPIENLFFNEKNKNKRNDLHNELSVRVKANQSSTKVKELIPDIIHYFSPDIPYFLVFDYSQSRLFLFQNIYTSSIPTPILIADQYLTIGKAGSLKQQMGDNKSPIGVYHITSFLPDDKIPELYGWGAFPINYPNHWDRKLARTGSGIWLHGVPRDNYSRAPLASRGCLVVSNVFLKSLADYITIGTPMILSDKLNWIQKKENTHSKELYKRLLSWKEKWKAKDLTSYADFYSNEFKIPNKNRDQWIKHKQRIFKQSKQIEITLSAISIASYPKEDNLISVSFTQEYKHGSFYSFGTKQQYWRKEDNQKWRIIYEKMDS